MNFLKNLLKKVDELEQKSPPNNSNIIVPYQNDFLIKDDDDNGNIDYRGLFSGEDYIRAILGDYSFKIELITQNRKERIEIIKKSFRSNVTHPGLIYYLGYCWGKEIGIVLRPDMIWSCILYEFSKHITETKEKYVNDFNNIFIKNENVYNGYMNSYDLVDKFRSYIKYDEFYDLITKERFSNEPKEFTEYKILAFCNFARVEYKKEKMNCKIPKFQIKGDKEDWIKLIELIDYLIHLISNRFFINYLENIKSLVSNLVTNVFQVMLSEPRLRYQGIKDMIKDIFYIKEGEVMGWGKELYFDCYMNPSRKWGLDNFNTHIAYIPYININEREACIKAGGLCYSILDNNFLEPFYGNILCKLNDAILYKKLI